MRTTFLGLVLATVVCGTGFAQEIEVSGTIKTTTGQPLPGVTVQVRGTDTRATTDAQGKYSITAPGNGVLLYALIGYRGTARTIAGRPVLDITMETVLPVLEPVIVTGYSAQSRASLTGSVGSVDVTSAQKQTTVSVLQALDGRVTGVTVDNGGSPGSRSTVRIRGPGSFQNNDPLYIIDGVPVEESYLNFLNPSEIASMQVLKDASAASIYGSRAGNGVVIIETKRGRTGRQEMSLDVRTGVTSPVRGYDGILEQDALRYFDVVRTQYRNAGLQIPTNIYGDSINPRVPDLIWPNNCTPNPCSTNPADPNYVDPSGYAYPDNLIIPGSPGTNWWKAVFGRGQFRDANLAITGGGDDNSYHVSFNVLDETGTARFTRLTRGVVRTNTNFRVNKFTIGENIGLSRERHYGGLDDNGLGEDNLIGKNIFMEPVVPVYDFGGNYAAGKGIDNLTNPLKQAWAASQNISTNDRLFGNLTGGLDAGRGFALKSVFGFNLTQNAFRGFNPIFPENTEPTNINSINENYSLGTEWTWWNTLNYQRLFGPHNVTVLLGQEAVKDIGRFEAGSCAALTTDDPNARYIQDPLCDPTSKNVTSSGRLKTLLSFFGKADYNYQDRYYVSLTVRRDGSSAFAADKRWGTFPAFGLAWRISQESFWPANSFLSNAKLRFGWGVTGNQRVPAGRVVSQLGGDRGDTFYDIGGSNTSIRPGYKVIAIGNPDFTWERNKSVNFGLDLEFSEGQGTFTADIYHRRTDSLLFDPRQPATASSAAGPIFNVGSMQNNGYELSLGYRGTIGGGTPTLWSVTFNGSHYRNKMLRVDNIGSTFFYGPIALREQNPVINEVGSPLGAFYGLVADGYYRDSLDAAQCGTGDTLGLCWDDGARPGRIKFKDLNGDHHISAADRAVIGSPHPTFTAGLDLQVRHGAWDISATFFGSFGNKIFNAQKYWTVFRYFNTNVRSDLLANSVVLDSTCAGAVCPGKVVNPGAKYPRADVSDVFSRQFSSFWVESGTYVRLRTLQIGYNVPLALIRWIPVARIYVQAENLFTITGYSGLDPALPAWDVTAASGDIRDRFRGIDEGSYPANRTFIIGISTTF